MKIKNYGIPRSFIPRRSKDRRDCGFTLIEILVAFAVIGIALTVLLQIFSGDLKGITESSDYVKAAIKAEAAMREVVESEELAEGSWDDITDDGYEISVTVDESLEERTENLAITLLEVNLTIRWMRDDKRRTLNLRTAKVIQKTI
jgi:general secretion pathway protein I